MITDKVRPYYTPMIPEMVEFYLKKGRDLTEGELFIAVSQIFGDQMLKHVCPHFGLELGECTIGAIDIMREEAAKLVPH